MAFITELKTPPLSEKHSQVRTLRPLFGLVKQRPIAGGFTGGERGLADHGRHVRHLVADKVGHEAEAPAPHAFLPVRGEGRLRNCVLAQLAAKIELRVQVAALGGFTVTLE